MLQRLFLLALLLLPACATSGEKIPGLLVEGKWKSEAARLVLPSFEPGLPFDRGFELVRVRHHLRHEVRRRRHLFPLEHRRVLVVFLEASDEVEAKELAKAEVFALRPDGRRLPLTLRSGFDESRRFEAVYNDGEDPAPAPVAYVVDGRRLSVPVD